MNTFIRSEKVLEITGLIGINFILRKEKRNEYFSEEFLDVHFDHGNLVYSFARAKEFEKFDQGVSVA